MTVRKGQLIDLSITDLAFGGKGIAKPEGFTVFVDQAAPGDQVLARIVKKKRQYAEARIVEMRTPSPLRVSPPCPYSGFCGGCKWQFLPYRTQLEYKQRHVADALARIGGLPAVPVHPPLGSERIFGYRNKMEFSCSDRRWLMPDELEAGVEAGMALGLHVPGTFHKVLDIEACLIQPSFGNTLLQAVREHIAASPLPVYGLKSHIGFWRFLTLRHSRARDRWMVNIITAQEERSAVAPLAERLLSDYPAVAGVVNNITARRAGIAVGEREVHLGGAPVLEDTIGPYTFEISANSFFQTNSAGAERLYDVAREYAGLAGSETVLDLYCGTGTIAIYLSASARTVTGIELAESAVRDAEANCRRNGVANCRFIAGDMRECLKGDIARPDVAVVDPPRDGMHKDVVARLLELAPPRMVYVSCNPSTLARDLALLKEKYQVHEVQPVDMFPHTYHIESVARLTLR